MLETWWAVSSRRCRLLSSLCTRCSNNTMHVLQPEGQTHNLLWSSFFHQQLTSPQSCDKFGMMRVTCFKQTINETYDNGFACEYHFLYEFHRMSETKTSILPYNDEHNHLPNLLQIKIQFSWIFLFILFSFGVFSNYICEVQRTTCICVISF